jgi:hypothetical protein
MEINELLLELQKQIANLRKAIETLRLPTNISDRWLPRSRVMEFLNYGPTQMAALEKSDKIVVTKVGKRKFILRDSIARLLDNNIVAP